MKLSLRMSQPARASCNTHASIKKNPGLEFASVPGFFVLVAGVRDEQQKVVFPPVDVIEIPLVARGRVLVPASAA